MSTSPNASADARTYRAHVDGRTFEVVLEDGRILVDGAPVEAAFEAVSGNHYALRVAGRSLSVVLEPEAGGRVGVTTAGRRLGVVVQDEKDLLLERFGLAGAAAAGAREVHAPMPGLVLSVLVAPGQAVAAGDGLVVLEAMKMENELRAEAEGIVRAVHVAPGAAVGKNDLLIEFEA